MRVEARLSLIERAAAAAAIAAAAVVAAPSTPTLIHPPKEPS